MAEAQNNDEIAFNTPVGAIKAHGFNVVVVLALVILSWLTFTQNIERSKEHDQIGCLLKLDIFVHTYKAGETIDPRTMPSDLWPCIPSFFYDAQHQQKRS